MSLFSSLRFLFSCPPSDLHFFKPCLWHEVDFPPLGKPHHWGANIWDPLVFLLTHPFTVHKKPLLTGITLQSFADPPTGTTYHFQAHIRWRELAIHPFEPTTNGTKRYDRRGYMAFSRHGFHKCEKCNLFYHSGHVKNRPSPETIHIIWGRWAAGEIMRGFGE